MLNSHFLRTVGQHLAVAGGLAAVLYVAEGIEKGSPNLTLGAAKASLKHAGLLLCVTVPIWGVIAIYWYARHRWRVRRYRRLLRELE